MRSHVRPLLNHPQLETIRTPLSEPSGDVAIEYRVQNFRCSKNGTIRRRDGFSWIDLIWAIGLVWTGREIDIGSEARQAFTTRSISVPILAWLLLVFLLLFRQTRIVLHESVIALPSLGIQLQTTRGISISLPFLASSNTYRVRIPLSTSSTLVPLEHIFTIIIHEGLRRWKVEYYLAIIKRSGGGIDVVFPHIRPPVAVLREVYHGLRGTLYDEFHDS